MPYDPFFVSQDGTPHPETKFVSVRHPHICDVPLHALEWGMPDNSHSQRKRSRPNSTSQRPPSETRVVQHNQPNHTEQNSIIKEVIKVVEKESEAVTIMGVAPLVDDRIRYVVEFMLKYVTSGNVEIEAKLGVLNEREQDVRAVELVPVLCETPIRPDSNRDTRFESNVGAEMFRRLNTRLNRRIEETSGKGQGRIQYLRTRERDVFWSGASRIRETKERRLGQGGAETYETIRVQRKKRLGDLNVLCPGKVADVRYSASLEEAGEVSPDSVVDMHRLKDRISYKYEYLSVDITCVETKKMNNPNELDTTFEVEVEVENSAQLYAEVVKFRERDESSKLFDIATSLVNTVRLLLEI